MGQYDQQIATLEEAIGTGVLEVQYRDRKVRYQSTEDMQKALDYLRRQNDPANPPTRTSRAAFYRE